MNKTLSSTDSAIIYSVAPRTTTHRTVFPTTRQQPTSIISTQTYASLNAARFPKASIVFNTHNAYDDINVFTTQTSLPDINTRLYAINDWFKSINVLHSGAISVTPDLRANYSHGRVTAGAWTVISDTTSAGYTLTGSAGAAVLNSINDVNLDDQADIAQKATSEKHRITTTKLASGITTIIGSDITKTFQPLCQIRPQKDDAYVWQWAARVPCTNNISNNSAMAIWFSQYTTAIAATNGSGTAASPHFAQITNVRINEPVNPMERPIIKVAVLPIGTGNNYGQPLTALIMSIAWCIGNQDGTISPYITNFTGAGAPDFVPESGETSQMPTQLTYIFDTTRITGPLSSSLIMPFGLVPNQATDFVQPVPNWTFSSHIPPEATIIGYMIYYQNPSTSTLQPSAIADHFQYSVSFTYPEHYSERQIAPKRVITWTNVGTDQNIIIKGSSDVQAIARTSITAFRKPDTPTLTSSKVFPVLQMLYGDMKFDHFRKVYSTPDYVQLAQLIHESPVKWLMMAVQNMDEEQKGVAHAAGVLSWLGDKIGSFVPQKWGRSVVQPGLRYLGEKADDFFERETAKQKRKRENTASAAGYLTVQSR